MLLLFSQGCADERGGAACRSTSLPWVSIPGGDDDSRGGEDGPGEDGDLVW